MDAQTCQKAQDSFVTAGALLSKIFKFTQKITVAAEFVDLCATVGGCSSSFTSKFKLKYNHFNISSNV